MIPNTEYQIYKYQTKIICLKLRNSKIILQVLIGQAQTRWIQTFINWLSLQSSCLLYYVSPCDLYLSQDVEQDGFVWWSSPSACKGCPCKLIVTVTFPFPLVASLRLLWSSLYGNESYNECVKRTKERCLSVFIFILVAETIVQILALVLAPFGCGEA